MSDPGCGDEFWREMERGYARSPWHRHLGLTLAVVGEGYAVVSFGETAGAMNARDKVAGGAIAAMADSAVVQAVRSRTGDDASLLTLEMKVNFLRGAARGVALSTAGTIEHMGKSTAVGLARTVDATGECIAISLVTVAIRRAGRSPGPLDVAVDAELAA